MDESFNLGAASPVFHLNSVDDRRLLDHLLVLFDIRLLKINTQRDVALWTVGLVCELLANLKSEAMEAQTRGIEIILGTFATKFVTARRSNCFFCSLVTDAADKYVLTAFAILFQDEIRMVSDLTHLHNQTEDVGVIVEQNTLRDVCFELSSTVIHDTTGEVILLFAEELAVDIDLLSWQFHC